MIAAKKPEKAITSAFDPLWLNSSFMLALSPIAAMAIDHETV